MDHAARGGNTVSSEVMQYAYFFWNTVTKLGDFAWFFDNSGGKTHAVGTREKNPLGLYDMGGNVEEWMQNKLEPESSVRLLRGGSWGHHAQYLRSAYRHGLQPELRANFIGFRLVRTAK